VSVTQAQAIAWQNSIRANGLPSQELQVLKNLGASAAEIQAATQLEINLDVNQIAGTTLFTELTDPAQLAALKTEANTFKAAA
jgi:hypothetical protein